MKKKKHEKLVVEAWGNRLLESQKQPPSCVYLTASQLPTRHMR